MEAYVRLPAAAPRSSTWPRSTPSTPARRWSSASGTRVTPAPWRPDLQILGTRGDDYAPTPFSLERGTELRQRDELHGVRRQQPQRRTGTVRVTTNTGGTACYNGCWLTITIPLDETTTRRTRQRHRHDRGWLVEDPLQHERCLERLLDRPHDLAGGASWQPRPPRAWSRRSAPSTSPSRASSHLGPMFDQPPVDRTPIAPSGHGRCVVGWGPMASGQGLADRALEGAAHANDLTIRR